MSRVTFYILLFMVSLSTPPISAAQTAPTVPQEQIALWDAVIAGDVAKADAGATINLANRSGFTPLHHAAEAGSKEAAALLIAKGANLTLRNLRNQTPIETATAFRHPEVAEVLRQATKTSK